MEDPKPLPQLPASRASKIAAVILMVFLFAGLLSNLRFASTTESVLPHAVTRAGILDGAVSKELANRMADTPIAADAARAQRALGWLTLHDLGPRVRQGCPGWLFLRDELSVYADSDSHLATRADTVAAVQRELARHGIALLIVVVPDKSRIEPQHLCSLYRPVSLGARLADWTSRLTADGVQVLDLSAALRGAPGGAFFGLTRTGPRTARVPRRRPWRSASVRWGARWVRVSPTIASRTSLPAGGPAILCVWPAWMICRRPGSRGLRLRPAVTTFLRLRRPRQPTICSAMPICLASP